MVHSGKAPPRRLHLRGRLVPGGPGHPLRPQDLRGRPHPRRREDRHVPLPGDRRRLSRRLPRLPARSRPPGRARTLALRGHVGQPRVLAGRAGRASSSPARTRGPDRPSRSPRTRPGSSTSPRAWPKPSGPSLETFDPPAVKDVKIERFDAFGLGDEPNNRTAIDSLKAYRALRYGRHLDSDPHRPAQLPEPRIRCDSPELGKLGGDEFPAMFPEELMQILDGGRAFDGGHPPARAALRNEHVSRTPPRTRRR